MSGAPLWEDVGEAHLFPFSIVREGSGRWYFDVTVDGNTVDIPKSYRTPGLALDAVIEWARQRGLTVPLAGQALTLRKPDNAAPESPSTGGSRSDG